MSAAPPSSGDSATKPAAGTGRIGVGTCNTFMSDGGGAGLNAFEFRRASAIKDKLWTHMASATYAGSLEAVRKAGAEVPKLLEAVKKHATSWKPPMVDLMVTPMADLINAKLLDLSKDIKEGVKTRFQPINSSAAVDEASGLTHLQLCLQDPDKFFHRMMLWWETHLETGSPYTSEELMGLWLWDCACWLAIKTEPENAAVLACESHLFTSDPEAPAGLRRSDPKELLGKLLTPYKAGTEEVQVLFLQEAHSKELVSDVLGPEWAVYSAPDPDATCLSLVAIKGVDPGLIVDLTSELKAALRIHLENTSIKPADIETTLSRVVSVCWKDVSCFGLHAKDPKLKTDEFAAAVAATCESLRKGMGGRSFFGGDFNIGMSSPPDMTPEEVEALLDKAEAEGDELPEEVSVLAVKFDEAASKAGLKILPGPRVCTGRKRRSKKQPQPKKAGKRQCTSKDRVGYNHPGDYEVLGVQIYGAETGEVPNCLYPSDHYGVKVSLKRKRP